jgi:hypothetical protein
MAMNTSIRSSNRKNQRRVVSIRLSDRELEELDQLVRELDGVEDGPRWRRPVSRGDAVVKAVRTTLGNTSDRA